MAIKAPLQYSFIGRRVARFEWRVDEYARSTDEPVLKRASVSKLADGLRGFMRIRLTQWTDPALADTAAMVCYSSLKRVLERWFSDEDNTQLQNDLLQGLPGLASAQPVQALWALTQACRGDSELTTWLTRTDAQAIYSELESGAHPDFYASLKQYLTELGFRYSGELMLTQATPAENPVPVIRLIQSYLGQDGPGPEATTLKRAQIREARTVELMTRLTPSKLMRRLPLPTRAMFLGHCLRLPRAQYV